LEDTKLKLDDLSNRMNNLEMLELELKNTKSIIELKDKENSLMSKDVSFFFYYFYYDCYILSL